MHERCLITGGHGFIGSHLSQKLEDEGNVVRTLEREEWNRIEETVVSINPNAIYHLAAYGNHYSQKDENETFRVNLKNFWELLQSTKNLQLRAFLNFGTSSEYGRKSSPMSEQDSLNPNTFYAATKASATLLAQAWSFQKNVNLITIRPFSVYGPGEADHRFIPTVIRCALTGEELTLTQGMHDWIYIDDFMSGIITISKNAKNLKGQVINLGSGKQYTNKEIVNIIAQLIGKPIKTKIVENLRSYDTTISWVANINRARSLGWKPSTEIEAGLAKTVEYYVKRIIA